MDNIAIFFLIFGLSNQHLMLDYLMIFGAEYVIYLTLLLIFIISIKGKVEERKSLILFLVSLPIIIVLIKIIHIFIFEQRPYVTEDIIPLISHKADASFPSRHTSVMAAIAFSYIFFKSRWYPLLLILNAWVGVARVYVGVHYPFDILGGFIVGLFSVILGRQVMKILKTKLL